MDTTSFIFCALLGIVFTNEIEDTKIRYYYQKIDKYTELPLNEANKIFSFDWYDPTKTTVIFAHGFTGRPDGPAVTEVITSLLHHSDSNVALLNWEHLAAPILPTLPASYVNWAAPNARKLGPRIADILIAMQSAGFNLNTTHLIGHSLGAQIFGIAGNALLQRGIQLPWITGLDPAAVGFEGRPLSMRLNPRSASFVAVVHSDPSKYGYSRPGGTVDFWPNYKNGPVRQPGCETRVGQMFSPEDLCNHNRCWQLLSDSLKYPGTLLGSHAKNYRIWKNYSLEERNRTVLEIGKLYTTDIIPGNYYFTTNAESPYGLGRNGL